MQIINKFFTKCGMVLEKDVYLVLSYTLLVRSVGKDHVRNIYGGAEYKHHHPVMEVCR